MAVQRAVNSLIQVRSLGEELDTQQPACVSRIPKTGNPKNELTHGSLAVGFGVRHLLGDHMSNWGIEDAGDLGGSTENTGPKALRDAYDALKKQNQELQNGLATIQQELQGQKVQATLSELGIPAAAAEQYKGEADPAKVREWATAMQSIFGGGSGQSNTPTPTEQATPALSPEQQAQFDRLNGAGQQGFPLGNVEAAAGRIGDATDIKGLLAAWQNLG